MKKVITDEISVMIKQMRADGMGYRQIASKLGLKSDTVKKYCKRNSMPGYLGGVNRETNYIKSIEKWKKYEKIFTKSHMGL